MIKYIELKSGFNDDGPAWVANVEESRSGATIYFNGKALKKGHGVSGNYFDSATSEEYWVSNIKKRGSNRHWAGTGKINIEEGAVKEFKELFHITKLDSKLYEVIPNLKKTNIQEFHENENMPL
jgi:hypothetical protein